jgi:tetratricopeptide (TPR) repeat protein
MTQTANAPVQPAPNDAPAQRAPSFDANALVAGGLALHQAGQLDAAAAVYRRVLTVTPDHFDSLHLLGVVFYQCGHLAQALQHIDTALKISPDNVFALNNRGIVLNALKRYDEALKSYDHVIALRPDYADAWLNRGNTLQECKRFAEALPNYDRALALKPDYPDALSNRGSVLTALGRMEEALASYDRALAVQPNHPGALLNKGNTLKDLQRFAAALQSYDRALALRPDYVDALSNRAVVLCELKRCEEALVSCDRALALRPDFAEAYSNRGNALHALERYEDAVASYDRALELRPDFADARANRGGALHALRRLDEALADYDRAVALPPERAEVHYNRGNVLHALKRFDDALNSYDRALTLRPDYAEALANRGVTLQDLQRFDEALAHYQRAQAVRPDFADAHYNEALCLLLTGDLVRGFEIHEWRWETDQHRGFKRNFAQPLWAGADDIAGKTILLHAEQGFGDTIQFCRYAPQVAARGVRVVLEVQELLRGLMATLPGIAQVIGRGETLPDFDIHCPLLSLPKAFATELATIPGAMPYLHASAEGLANWNERLGGKDRPRIGLAWSGRPTHKNDHNRSIALAAFLEVLAGVNAAVVSVQRDVRGADADVLRQRSDIVHFGEELKDFADTAALVANLDLVVAVDTSVAHLAGALGKPVWVLLPFVPDWRWLLNREDSPWYPTARLFRQDVSRRWDGVIAQVNAALRDFVRCEA